MPRFMGSIIGSGAGLTARLERYREKRDDGPGPATALSGSGLIVGDLIGSATSALVIELSSGAMTGTYHT